MDEIKTKNVQVRVRGDAVTSLEIRSGSDVYNIDAEVVDGHVVVNVQVPVNVIIKKRKANDGKEILQTLSRDV